MSDHDDGKAAAFEILIAEYDSLKSAVNQRLKASLSKMFVIGAIAALLLHQADQMSTDAPQIVMLVFSMAGVAALGWSVFLNLRWVQQCGSQLDAIETRVNRYYGTRVLGARRGRHGHRSAGGSARA